MSNPAPNPTLDSELRPESLDTIVGQESIKDTLRVFIESAKLRNRTLDHVFLAGPPGLGKTTIASTIAHEMSHDMILLHGPNVSPTVLWQLCEDGGTIRESPIPVILFIDEIQGVEKATFTALLPLMERFIYLNQQVPPFTVVGATTDPAKVPNALRDRFGIQYTLDYYPTEQIEEILKRNFPKMHPGGSYAPDAIEAVALRSRGTPRIANRLMRRALDYHWVDERRTGSGARPFSKASVTRAMTGMGIDKDGLDDLDRRILVAMWDRWHGKPTGIAAIASAVGEDQKTLELVKEPWLVRAGFINREKRGRSLTAQGITKASLTMAEKVEFE